MLKTGTLHVFTINFPLVSGENFLYTELVHLSTKFKKIYIFPMHIHKKDSLYTLPENVEVLRFNVFQPYNRINVLTKNKTLVFKLFAHEITQSANKLKYITQFKSSVNDLMHKIAMANFLKLFLEENNQDIEIAYTYWFNQWTFILSHLHKNKPRFKLFSRIHGSDVYEEQHSEKNFFFRFRSYQLKEITNVLAISENGMRHFKKKNEVYEKKIILSRLGTSDHGVGNKEHKNFYRLVSCSALQEYKRVYLIIEILLNIKLKIEWVHFGDGELRNEILEKSKMLPLNISFKFMGTQNNSDIMDYYKKNHVDLFINVSSSEGIPVSIMEAISFGIPILATNIGGVSEIVNDQTGYLIDKEFDPKQTAEMLESHLLKTDEDKIKLHQSTRSFWENNFNADINYNKLFSQLTNA